jgi:hypothetical protein
MVMNSLTNIPVFQFFIHPINADYANIFLLKIFPSETDEPN